MTRGRWTGDSVVLSADQNPLRVDRVHAIGYRFPEGDWPQQLERLERLRFRAAILGDHGRGKTTLLRELACRLPGAAYLEVPRDRRRQPETYRQAQRLAGAGARLLVDGMERLRWLARRRWYRLGQQAAGLVVTVHRPCPLPVWVHCQSSEALLIQLLGDAGLGGIEVIQAGRQALAQSRGNIRDAMRLLYDDLAMGRLALDSSSRMAGPGPAQNLFDSESALRYCASDLVQFGSDAGSFPPGR